MAKENALGITLIDGVTADKLAEVLDGVIENVQASSISEQIKAKNGSGTPEGGSIEYKRFANAQIKDKGTARTAGGGDKVKNTPVIVNIDTDKEIVEELALKDVKLYGVAGMAEKRKINHENQIKAYLDREFFLKVLEGTNCEEKETVKATVDDLLFRARTLKNSFVDGIDSEMLVLVLDPTYRKAMKDYLDGVPNGTDPRSAAIGSYDSVLTFESQRLPDGVRVAVMIDGAIAQPWYVTEYNAEKIPLDDAIALENFLYKGTKAVMADTIFYARDAASGLTVVSAASATTSGKTALTVTPEKATGNSYKYKTAASVTVPDIGTKVTTGWTTWDGEAEIAATTGNKIVVVEVNSANEVVLAGIAEVTSKA